MLCLNVVLGQLMRFRPKSNTTTTTKNEVTNLSSSAKQVLTTAEL